MIYGTKDKPKSGGGLKRDTILLSSRMPCFQYNLIDGALIADLLLDRVQKVRGLLCDATRPDGSGQDWLGRKVLNMMFDEVNRRRMQDITIFLNRMEDMGQKF